MEAGFHPVPIMLDLAEYTLRGHAQRATRKLFPDMGSGVVPGGRADLLVLREGPPLTVVVTIVEGEVVYQQT